MLTNASLTRALKKSAKESGTAYSETVFRFLAEEFLRRLGKSQYKEKLVLRGGHLVQLLTDFEGISSHGLDFLYTDASGDFDEIINTVINTETQFSCCSFTAGPAAALDEKTDYKGMRINITAYIGCMRMNFDIDIGLGDVLYHRTEETEFASVLPGAEDISVFTYPVESVVAEKLDIVMKRFELNNCIKHMYDIVLLAMTFDFDGYELQKAVKTTVEHRGNDCGKDRIADFEKFESNADFINRWKHFCIVNSVDMDFPRALEIMINFIAPVWENLSSGSRLQKNWSGSALVWQDPVYLY